jgi:hypothetical protein
LPAKPLLASQFFRFFSVRFGHAAALQLVKQGLPRSRMCSMII